MANQKISELTAIATIDNATDVLPIVDTSATTTKKITLTQVKTSLALNNVDNTSDANKPVSTAQQTALDAKVTGNPAITGATKTKVTYDAKGLVTAGNILDPADMPMAIDAANIGAGVVSSTEFGYLDGVTSAIQTQLNAKQATLVSATNIKTINSTSLLGSGDISISANPSGVSGAIQFSNGSAFASDAANFFWDDTNNRLGIGTNTPSATAHFKGSGSTSATTSFLVQNSGATEIVKVTDDGTVTLGTTGNSILRVRKNDSILMYSFGGNDLHLGNGTTNYLSITGNGNVHIKAGSGAMNSSAQLDVESTTRGFLPPRMTTTQRNAIASPAAGLVLYDSTTNKLQCYNGSTWNDLF